MSAKEKRQSLRDTESKRYILYLVAVLSLGLALRLAFFISFEATPFSRHPLIDARHYDEMGKKVASGRLIQERAFFMGPLYSYFLGFLYAAAGHRPALVRMVQMLIGLFLCAGVFLFGRRLFSSAAGLFAAFLLAVYKPGLFYEQTLLMETMLGFFCLLIPALFLFSRNPGRPLILFFAGLFIGLAALLRGNILLFPLFLTVWVLFRKRGEAIRRDTGTALRRGAVFFAGILVGILPATLHNYLAEGLFIPISSNDGINLYIGNNENATGCYEPPPGVNMSMDIRGERAAELALGRSSLSSKEISSYWKSLALNHIKSHPFLFIKRLFIKFYYFWGRVELEQIYSLEQMKKILPPLRWPLVNFVILGPLSLMGIAIALFRKNKGIMIPVLFLAAYMVSLLPFFITARYRIPVTPLLSVFAGFALVQTGRALKEHKWKPVGFLLGGVVFLTLILDNSSSIPRRQSAEAFHNSLGLFYQREGRLDEAIGEFRKAMDYGESALISYNLGRAFYLKKDMEPAIQYYRKAARLEPGNARYHFHLGQSLLESGRKKEAFTEFREAVRLDPKVHPLASYNLAFLYLTQGEREKAAKFMQQYLRMEPGDKDALETFRRFGGDLKGGQSSPEKKD